jgi:hypothetical protein
MGHIDQLKTMIPRPIEHSKSTMDVIRQDINDKTSGGKNMISSNEVYTSMSVP